VSDLIWRRDFANRSRIGDAKIQVRDQLYAIVGVLPTGTERSLRGEVYLPDTANAQALGGLVVRLKSSYTVADFQTRLKVLNERLTKAYAGPKDRGFSAFIQPLRPDPLVVRDFHRAMVGGAICILLIACANVAALMLARGLVKKRDYALRLALGARPRDVGIEVVLEIGTVALIGCVAGAVVTSWFVGVIGRAMPAEMGWQGFVQPQWSWRVLALAMLAVVTSVAVLAGSRRANAARTDPAGPLKEGASSTTGRTHTRFRWLVIAELAMAMTLLMSGSLMYKSISRMEEYDFGYPTERLVRAGVGMSWREDSTTLDEQARLRQQGLEVVRAVPGVEAAMLVSRRAAVPRSTE